MLFQFFFFFFGVGGGGGGGGGEGGGVGATILQRRGSRIKCDRFPILRAPKRELLVGSGGMLSRKIFEI